MTEIDKTGNVQSAVPQTKSSVLARFIANFSGGMSSNTMIDSGSAAMAQASAQMDSRVVHGALQVGGHSTVRRAGSFLSMVSMEGSIDNTVQSLPGKVIHITEVKGISEQPIKEALKPAVITGDLELAGKPSRTFVLNVFSIDPEPSPDIKQWFENSGDMVRAA